MSDINDGGPAFPVPQHQPLLNGGWLSEYVGYPRSGMTLRDYFAANVDVPDDIGWVATALMGECPPKWSSDFDVEQCLVCAKWWAMCRAKYRLMEADAMLAERAKKGGGK